MIKQGLLEESDRRPAADADDERRRYYAITDFGRRVLRAETARMRVLVTAADAAGGLSNVSDQSSMTRGRTVYGLRVSEWALRKMLVSLLV